MRVRTRVHVKTTSTHFVILLTCTNTDNLYVFLIIQMVTDLLNANAQPDGYRDPINGGTALMQASRTGWTDAVCNVIV
jgi:hypothetical protein